MNNKEIILNHLKQYKLTNDLSYLIKAKEQINIMLGSNKNLKYVSNYYKQNGIETIDKIKDLLKDNLNDYLLGTIVRYIDRYGLKKQDNMYFDLIKARNYIDYILYKKFGR